MYIELLILIKIEMGPKYGYEIKKEIEKDLGYLIDVNHNALYPALRRFTAEGLVTKQLNEQLDRPNQYIYQITELGRSRITELTSEFSEKEASNKIEFMIRVYLFSRISATQRMRILTRRSAVLRSGYIDLEQRKLRDCSDEYEKEVLEQSMQQIKHELDWIEKLIITNQQTG